MKTWVLCLRRRNAFECTIRSRSRWNGVRWSESGCARRAGYERVASGDSSFSLRSIRSRKRVRTAWVTGARLSAREALAGAEGGRARVELVQLEPAGVRLAAPALEQVVGVVVLDRRPVTGRRPGGAAGELPHGLDRPVALADVRVLPVGAADEPRGRADPGAAREVRLARRRIAAAAARHGERGEPRGYCGSGGVLNHGQSFESAWMAAKHWSSSSSWARLPIPRLVLQSLGRLSGSLVMLAAVPSRPMFEYQQLFVLLKNSSHQKSVPFGSRRPWGSIPITLSWKRLRYEVETLDSSQPACSLPPAPGPHTKASGTANSIVPRRQLSQKWLLRTVMLLPPAIHMPVPTGSGTVG